MTLKLKAVTFGKRFDTYGPVLVNWDFVRYAIPADPPQTWNTCLKFPEDREVYVTETLEEIEAMLGDVRAKAPVTGEVEDPCAFCDAFASDPDDLKCDVCRPKAPVPADPTPIFSSLCEAVEANKKRQNGPTEAEVEEALTRR